MNALLRLTAFGVWDVDHVGDHIVNFEVIVDGESNVHFVNRVTRFARPLAGNDERIGFDVGQVGFDVPQAIPPLESRIDHGAGVRKFSRGG